MPQNVKMEENPNASTTNRKLNITSNLHPLCLEGNLSNNWKKWHQSFIIFLKASGLHDESDERKVAVFLHFIGEKALDIYNTFDLDTDTVKFELLIKKFQDYFVPKTNITYESNKFFTRKQAEGESIEDFITDLKNKSKSCEFGQLTDRIVKDIFICNLHENFHFVREKLLLEDNLCLDKAVSIAKTLIQSQSQASELKSQTTNVFYSKQSQKGNTSYKMSNVKSKSQSKAQSANKCGRCGQVHRHKCPALKAKCRKCNLIGHYEAFCHTKRVRFVQVSDSDEQEFQGNEFNNLFIGHLKSSTSVNTDWNINFVINNIKINCILDTGSDANVMSLKMYESLKIPNKLAPCLAKVTSYSGNSIKILGQQDVECSYYVNTQQMSKTINFIIADVSSPTVIGRYTCSELGLVKRVYNIQQSSEQISNQSNVKESYVHQSSVNTINLNELLSNNESCFVGLGCLPGECHITVNKDIPPKIDAPRKVPFALHDRLKKELDTMEKMDVIAKVTEPTSWVSSLLLVEKKNHQLRVCLDPRNLNQAICRSHYPIPTVDMVRSKLHGAAYFSTLDASSGFWAINLDLPSSMLCTFNTPFGRYRFKRLPYGINCAPELFHRIMTETFGILPGVIVYADDLLVYGSTLQDHNENLQRVLEKALEVNLKFNKSKCTFGQNKVKYLGHIFSKNGVSPDPEKVRAIKDMPSPTCLKDLQRFLGLLNYLGSFIKNLATETESLRELLKKSSIWQWNACHEVTFCRLKDIICQAPVLAHFNVNKSVVLSVDASQSAVGAVLLQDNHPICYASKTLTSSQERMAQIEKELYAIVFGCIRFHQYIYGQVVKVETDHRPLITLFKKPLAEVPTRLQRLMMRIQAYDLRVEYKQGSKMFIADSLSRAALPECQTDEIDEDLVIHVNLLINNLPISTERVKWLAEATKNDKSMQILKQYYKEGWPTRKSDVSQLVLPYWNYRHDIHVIGDLILKGNSLIIPSKLRPDILKIIHSGHLGIEKSKSFARGIVYWPLMSHDIENLVQNCQTCLTYRSANAPEPLMSHKIATFPWEKVGIDFLQFKNQTIVVVEDYYSNYIEIANVSTTSAKALINALKPIFSRHGIPVEIMSDNGPPYNSKEFQDFIKTWGIQHSTSSPYLPRSNGLVESGVKIVKHILNKCSESGTDPYLALLQYRTTPRGNLPSPSQLLMSRMLRTQMPAVLEHFKPRLVNNEDYIRNKKQNLNKQKFYYDKKSKYLPPLNEGDYIMYKKSPDSKWMPGKVLKKCEEPRSFIIESPDGIYRRNRQHLLKPTLKEGEEVEKSDEPENESNDIEPIKENKKDKKPQGKIVEKPGHDKSQYRTLAGRQVKPTKRFYPE